MKTHERYCDYSPWLASHLAHEALHHPHECLAEDPYYKTLATLSPDDANNEIRTLLQPNNRYVFVGGRVGPITRFRIKKICNRHSH
jgi:hypothetical protein